MNQISLDWIMIFLTVSLHKKLYTSTIRPKIDVCNKSLEISTPTIINNISFTILKEI